MNITPEMIEALTWLRNGWDGDNSERAVKAFDTLDNGGIFKPIDEATGYDVTLNERLRRGIEQAQRGETKDRGSFAQYLDDDVDPPTLESGDTPAEPLIVDGQQRLSAARSHDNGAERTGFTASFDGVTVKQRFKDA